MLTSLRAILRGAARSLGVERAANAALIEEMWNDVVGPEAAGHSRFLGVRGTIVLAESDVGPWTQELSAQRARYVAEINRRLGGHVVTEMRFRQAPGPARAPERARKSVPTAAGAAAGASAAGQADREELSVDELAVVEQALAEIADPEIREGARRAMVSQMQWRKRQERTDGPP